MNRPKIILYVCASADGRITCGPNTTLFDWYKNSELYGMLIGFDEWTEFTAVIKEMHRPDMSLEGSNMLVAENEKLKDLPSFSGDPAPLYEDFLPDEITARQERKTWTAVIDGRGRVRGGYTGVDDDPATYVVHLVSRAAPAEYLGFLRSVPIPYLMEGDGKVDLPAMLSKVKTKLGVETIVTSSGGRLAGALIRQSLLDEINILVSPLVIGGSAVPTLFDSPDPVWPDIKPKRLQLIDCRKMEHAKVWIRYRVHTE
ncbi:MAG: dihydrofolate reductase family protein [Spirochaetales bacterium]|nr:dihydrofolate reductase family protein [Spirochaetales bacterium]